MNLSIVSSMYMSEPFVNEFYKRIRIAADKITQEWELILVNDGSPDCSLHEAKSLAEKDSRVRVIDLSRNFGHHKALLTGLMYATGEKVFLIDIDLEEEPELLNVFWDAMSSDPAADVVYGIQQARKGGLFERVSGRWFYALFNALSDVKISEDLLIARLMTQRYVQSLTQFGEADIVFAGVAALAGYRQIPLLVTKGHKKSTTYSLSRKIKIMLDVVTSFSAKPLIWLFYTGAFVSALSLLGVSILLYQKLILNLPVAGWTSVVASIWFFGGLTLLSLGLIGIYVAKIFVQVKQRPFSIVREAVGFMEEPKTGSNSSVKSDVTQGIASNNPTNSLK